MNRGVLDRNILKGVPVFSWIRKDECGGGNDGNL